MSLILLGPVIAAPTPPPVQPPPIEAPGGQTFRIGTFKIVLTIEGKR